MNKYKCDSHKLNFACIGCIKAWIHRHDAMLEFVKKIADKPNLDWQEDAIELLKEIGK